MNRPGLKTSATATALALGALVAVSGGTAAFAAKPYTGDDTIQNIAAPGSSSNFLAWFTANPGAVTTVTFAGTTYTVTAGADGSLPLELTVPADATPGSVLTGLISSGGVDTEFAVQVAGAPTAKAAAAPAPSGDMSSLLWFGTGIVVLAGAAITVGAITRRARA